jgi:peroxiredoxin
MKKLFGVVGLAVALFVSACAIGEMKAAPPIGDDMPGFTLKDASGKDHTLAQYKGKVVVLNFMSPECPWSKGADLSWPELAKKYAGQDVVFLAIDSHKSTTVEQLKAYAAEKKLPYPILKDVDNKYADAVGATRTPEVYVLNRELKLAYHGAYDNRKEPEATGDANYVQAALDDLLAGRPVKTAQVDAWGCSIKRR